MTLPNDAISKAVKRGFTTILPLTVSVKFLADSFGHIGASKSPLAGKDLPVFKIDDRPVIPGTSLKGAWRSRLEALLQEKAAELATKFSVPAEHLRPCIPTTKPSQAEQERFSGKRWLTGCQVELEEGKVFVNPRHKDGERKFLCPVCYFFGATGLQGFVRVGHLVPPASAVALYEQTITSRDRAVDGVRKGAFATGEHVKGGTQFQGTAELLLFDGMFTFGEPRSIGGINLDPWLQSLGAKQSDLTQSQLTLVNDLLIPAFEKIDVLGGHRSKGGGRVQVGVEIGSQGVKTATTR
jgi:hypothetical protein